MAYLRHSTRHVYETITQHVYDWMDSLFWFGPAESTPFGATPAAYQVGRMDEATVKQITGNLLAVSFGDEQPEDELELGGLLVKQEYALYVDCIGESDAVSLSMAVDVKDCLLGNAPGTSRFLQVQDYTNSSPIQLEGYTIEFVDVMRRKPEVAYRTNWNVIQAACELIYVKEEGG